ncbi:MAG: glycosyltransferase, partial [Alistipes sp.]|nr:glycosyltransferase [Alistipes sp.]
MSDSSVSVIIPLYNKEREIAGTLRSVLAQTLRPKEIIVVDDGSTDRSASIVDAVAAEEGLIRLVRQPNAGECAARNRAIAEVGGGSDLVALLDADDEWEPGFLEEIANLRREYPGCGIYSTGF